MPVAPRWCDAGRVTGRSSEETAILHIDLDAFFASVELLDRPELRAAPVVVARDTERSVVTSANYPARRFGLRSAMPLSQAKRLCPRVVVLEPHMERYREYSRTVMGIFRDVTPLVEPLSIDEAFLDVAGAVRRLGPARDIAAGIRARVEDETRLTCSVGIASTKFLAKLASGRAKPDGMLVIEPANALDYLHPLPVGALWGVGEATGAVLARLGIRTIGDLAQTPGEVVRRALGEASGRRLHDLAHGIDPRRVTPGGEEKSIGHETTFEHDVSDPHALRRVLLDQATRASRRLREARLLARTVALKLRYSDFTTVTRSRTLPEPSDVGRRVYHELSVLLGSLEPLRQPVRLIGGRLEQLVPQHDAGGALWDPDEEWRDAENAVDGVTGRFGAGSLGPASLLGESSRAIGDTSRYRRERPAGRLGT